MEKYMAHAGFTIWFLIALSIFSLYYYLEKLWSIIRFAQNSISRAAGFRPGDGGAAADFSAETDLAIEKFKVSLSKLGSIATLSPYIGLFGTVIGIMDAFSEIAKSGTSNFAYVSKGISEALVATAFGLFLAIMSTFCYNHLIAKLRIVQCEKDAAIEKLSRKAGCADKNEP